MPHMAVIVVSSIHRNTDTKRQRTYVECFCSQIRPSCLFVRKTVCIYNGQTG